MTFNQRCLKIRLEQEKRYDENVGLYYPYSIKVSRPKPSEVVQTYSSFSDFDNDSEKRTGKPVTTDA